MAEFKTIETQEQFDSAIKDRLERERNSVRKEYADYESLKSGLEAKTKETEQLAGKISGYEKEISELKTKLSKSETDSAKTRIAMEFGLPKELISRLTGTNEEEIRKDAEMLQKFFNNPKQAPLFNPEGKQPDAKEAAYKDLAAALTKK